MDTRLLRTSAPLVSEASIRDLRFLNRDRETPSESEENARQSRNARAVRDDAKKFQK
jgi:hypothetical protein